MRPMKIPSLTRQHDEVLRAQPITAEGPGTVLHDFDVLLRFIGTHGIETAGELRLPPIKVLPDLNAAMREPLRVDLQRGQLKSYPNLAALQMLGRATGLVMLQGGGDATRLAVDGELLRQWLEFNPLERYCTLLDAWALHASGGAIGEHGGMGNLLKRTRLLAGHPEEWSQVLNQPTRRRLGLQRTRLRPV